MYGSFSGWSIPNTITTSVVKVDERSDWDGNERVKERGEKGGWRKGERSPSPSLFLLDVDHSNKKQDANIHSS